MIKINVELSFPFPPPFSNDNFALMFLFKLVISGIKKMFKMTFSTVRYITILSNKVIYLSPCMEENI